MGEITDRIKGKIKRAAGALTGNRKLERSGRVDQAKGTVKDVAADVKRAVKRAVKR